MDLQQHLLRQMAFSRATFGHDERFKGVIDHIRKELNELEALSNSETRPYEWVDVVILALDGLWRSLATRHPMSSPETIAKEIVDIILFKQAKNEKRIWPDWRTAATDKAIEHDRSGE